MSVDQPPGTEQAVPQREPLPASNVRPVAPQIPTPAAYQPAPYPQPFVWRLPKSRTTALLLALFLGFITWMYTYERDAWKFWTAFAIAIVNTLLTVFTLGVWLVVAIPLALGIWIWGVVDVAVRPQQFYDLYPAA